MIIKEAKFVISNTNPQLCPESDIPEYAFLGRSNVGKSSLINMLCSRKNLAKTSGTPGKTRLINHFLINDMWYLVDLPGIGYARISKTEKNKWKNMIFNYIKSRKNLVTTFYLVDSRHEPQSNDIEFLDWFGKNKIPFVIVFTKTDKLSKRQLGLNIVTYKEKLLEKWTELPTAFVTSSMKKSGRDEILDFIEECNE